jgi:NADPH:quinone reductase-like Zn-dependent oxidoreductase
MKAFVLRSFGSPDVLELADVDKPVPGAGEVLVRVRATSVNPADWHLMRGEPRVARLMGVMGVRRPKVGILGVDLAGEVEATGAGVTAFRPGDAVYALLRQGGFAEYVCVPEGDLAPKPANLTYEQAAAVPMAATTALIALREAGRVRPGHRVLVNGASGGVGTFAVQLARAFGAEVIGVCGPRNVDMVRSIGATSVIDYSTADFTTAGRSYDLLLDIAGGRRASACRRVLVPDGTYVAVGGQAGKWAQPVGHMFAALAAGPFVSQRIARADVFACAHFQQNLMILTELIEAGRVTPVIDRLYPFGDIPVAVAYQEGGHAPGKVVITL